MIFLAQHCNDLSDVLIVAITFAFCAFFWWLILK